MNQSYPQQPQYAHYPPAPQTYSPPPQQELGSQASRYQTYNDFNQSQYNQTYSRDGQASAGAGSKRAKLFSLEFVSTKWPRIFMLVVSLQAILCLAFEAYVLSPFPFISMIDTPFDFGGTGVHTQLGLFLALSLI